MKPSEVVDVVFRVDEEKVCFALFPSLPGTRDPRTCESYQHVGQHFSADYEHSILGSRPAKPAEYAALERELGGVGYRLNVLKQAPRKVRR